jgi:GTP1/Obg family GTP-binding protein
MTNWTTDLTPEQQQDFYNEIVDYFTNEVVHEVLEKYDKSVDFNVHSV